MCIRDSDGIIKIFSWTNPSYTLSILVLYTFLILKPVLVLTTVPLFYLLFGIMVPQYLYLHKPDPNELLERNPTPAQGPPLRKVELPKPVPELSQEFLLNLTDLQNHMLLYVQLYDGINSILCKFAFFKNEQVSSFTFVVILSVALFLFLYVEEILPFISPNIKIILILLAWSFTVQMHPSHRDAFLTGLHSEETRLKILTLSNKYELMINEYLKFVEAREHKFVYVYEIQKYREKHKEWHPVGYTTDDYSLLSNLRVKESKIENFIEKALDDIKPPIEWEWAKNSSWVLDLNPEEWVRNGFIQYVEIDSGTKWVYDIDLNGKRGEYRRRMWTNVCTRKIKIQSFTPGTHHDGARVQDKENVHEHVNSFGNDSNTIVEEVVNPLREKKMYSRNIQGVARGSLAGATHLEDDDLHTHEGNRSKQSLDAINESSAIDEDEQLLDASNSFAAYGNFADVLNSSL